MSTCTMLLKVNKGGNNIPTKPPRPVESTSPPEASNSQPMLMHIPSLKTELLSSLCEDVAAIFRLEFQAALGEKSFFN